MPLAPALPRYRPPSLENGESLIWLVSACVAFLCMIPALLLPPDVTQGSIMAFGDASCFYCAGLRSTAGLSLYDERFFDCFTKTPFLHPPVSLLIFQPWALLPLKAAIVIYYLAQFWALGTIGTALWRYANAATWPRWAKYALIASVSLSNIIAHNLILGQLNLLALALALTAARKLENRQEYAAGACLLLAAVLKPYFIILGLMLLPGRSYKALLTACVGGITLCLISLALHGTQPWLEYMVFSTQYMSLKNGILIQQEWAQHGNISLLALFQRLGFTYSDALFLWQLALVPLLGMGLYTYLRLWAARAQPITCLNLLLSGMAVMMPLIWQLYLPWVLLAGIWAARLLRYQVAVLVISLIPWIVLEKRITPDLLTPLPLLLLALYIGVIYRILKEERR